MATTPALFIGHGSPMNTLEANGYTEAWRAFGAQLPDLRRAPAPWRAAGPDQHLTRRT